MPQDKWDLFYDLLALRERINQLFDESLMRGKAAADLQAGGAWQPPVDAWETADEIVVTAEIPGVDVRDIDVKIEGGALSIRGASEVDAGNGKATFHRMERAHGAFFRSFNLPESVNPDGISAICSAGILRVRLPKRTNARARTIQVK